MSEKQLSLLDIVAPIHEVEVRISADGQSLWVNIDGLCRLRVVRAPKINIEDDRKARNSP